MWTEIEVEVEVEVGIEVEVEVEVQIERMSHSIFLENKACHNLKK